MPRIERPRAGAILLEVLIAMTILAIAGGTVIALAAESGQVVRRVRVREQEVEAASALLDHIALWGREDLDRHLGDHPQGGWRLNIAARNPSLYEVSLRDSLAEETLLHTVLYRPLNRAGSDAP